MPCPVCKKEISWEGNSYRPFCSERCQVIDLGNWASGKYVISEKDKDAAADSGATATEEDAKGDR